jgi:hypothetical protein
MKATKKQDSCWSCGAPLDRPCDGREPEKHGCGEHGCVVCPKCGEPLCAYEASQKQAKVQQIKGMIRDAGGGPDGSDGPDGSEPPSDQLAAVDPFPTDVLPPLLARYVREGARAVGCPEDFFGVAVLALAGSAVGNSRAIELKLTWRERACLWMAIVGDPGMMKSPMLGLVTKPFEDRQLRLEVKFARELRAYEEELEQHEQAKKAKKRRPAAEPGQPAHEQEGDIVRAADAYPRPQEPILERCITSDATVEAIARLQKENLRGLVLCRDELAAWTRSMNQYRGGRGSDRQFFMSIWSGASIVLDRKGERRPLIVPSPFLAIVGGLCPDMLGELADEAGRQDGFTDRVLFSYPDPSPPAVWTEEGISAAAEDAWRRAVEALFALEPELIDGRLMARTVHLSPDAKQVWVEFFNGHSRDMGAADFPTGLKGFYSKLRGYAARLALILHALRVVTGESSSDEAVDEESMRGGVLLAEYFATHAARVHGLLSGGHDASDTDAALAYALEQLLDAHQGRWQGTAAQLLDAINGMVDPAVRGREAWPTSPESLGRALRRLAPGLKKVHRIDAQFSRAPGKDRTRLVTLNILSEPSEPSEPSAADATPEGETGCTSDGSNGPPATAKQTVRAPGERVRTVPGDRPRKPGKPSRAHLPKAQTLTASADGSDGSDGSSG